LRILKKQRQEPYNINKTRGFGLKDEHKALD